MMVLLASSLFSGSVNTLALDAIAVHAMHEKHRVILENDRNLDFLQWLDTLSPVHKEQWTFAISRGYQLEAREPARRTISVVPTETSNWSANPPLVSLNDAVVFLNRPFHLLLEDAVSDRNFLLKMATPEQKVALLAQEAKGAVIFENGGGITSMPRRIEAIRQEGQTSILRCWVMFDSDALSPNVPSDQSERLKNKCLETGLPFYQLQRRSIESYLPLPALSGWAYNERKYRAIRHPVFQAYSSMSKVQKHHYNLKNGFEADARRRGSNAGNLYKDLGQAHKVALSKGFGSDIGALFSTDHVVEVHLRRDGGWAEINPVITDLIAILR